MREIKYRIPVRCQNWHKAFWYGVVSNTEIEMHDRNISGFQNGVPEDQKCGCPKIGFGEGYFRRGDNQLFTGLHDKNGVEIYEGDILKSNADGCGFMDFVVGWDDVSARFNALFDLGIKIPNMAWPLRAEVIGNIHENPELLK